MSKRKMKQASTSRQKWKVKNLRIIQLFNFPSLQLHQQNHVQQQILNTPSVHAGYLYLARMFCRLVKEAVDLARKLKGEVSRMHNKYFISKTLCLALSVQQEL